MRKRMHGRKFGRKRDQRNALLLSVARSLIQKERIRTTEAKAKEISSFIEKLITKAKKGDLAARRELIAYFEPTVTKKLVDDIAPRYKERSGGYTRVVKVEPRKSDGAKMAIIEFVQH